MDCMSAGPEGDLVVAVAGLILRAKSPSTVDIEEKITALGLQGKTAADVMARASTLASEVSTSIQKSMTDKDVIDLLRHRYLVAGLVSTGVPETYAAGLVGFLSETTAKSRTPQERAALYGLRPDAEVPRSSSVGGDARGSEAQGITGVLAWCLGSWWRLLFTLWMLCFLHLGVSSLESHALDDELTSMLEACAIGAAPWCIRAIILTLTRRNDRQR